jgi:SP family myo-inositol transporter-like MFS transporter 13
MDSKLFDENSFGNDKVDVHHSEDLQTSDSFSDDDAIEDANPSRAVWFICMTASMGGFLFGALNSLLFPLTSLTNE